MCRTGTDQYSILYGLGYNCAEFLAFIEDLEISIWKKKSGTAQSKLKNEILSRRWALGAQLLSFFPLMSPTFRNIKYLIQCFDGLPLSLTSYDIIVFHTTTA